MVLNCLLGENTMIDPVFIQGRLKTYKILLGEKIWEKLFKAREDQLEEEMWKVVNAYEELVNDAWKVHQSLKGK